MKRTRNDRIDLNRQGLKIYIASVLWLAAFGCSGESNDVLTYEELGR